MIVCTETVLIGRKCDPMEEKVKQQYDRWLSQPGMPADLAEELKSIAGNEDAITDRFYRELEFGTGGLRGVIGAGTNRMNVYNIRKATQGLANYLNASDLPKKVAIGYDSRIKSDVFAKETAAVLAANGIKAYIYPRLEPTPALSWAVRYYGCGAGVCITASHNPAKYNGYKVYGADGCQIGPETADAVLAIIEQLDYFTSPKYADFEEAKWEGKIIEIPDSCLEVFVDAVSAQRVGGGAGIEEGVASLSGYADIFKRHTAASGLIPQIAVIVGPCAGGACYAPALCDFIFMVQDIGKMFITGPKVVQPVIGEESTPEELGGARIHAEKSGGTHFTFADEPSCFADVRRLRT